MKKMKEWFDKLDTTKKMVVKYLRDYPHTRDSDKELFFMILRALIFTSFYSWAVGVEYMSYVRYFFI